MSSQKRWKRLSGGTFFKFSAKGDCLEGVWQGTQDGKFGENGVVEVGGVFQIFSLNAALKDLIRVPKGTAVSITYTGKRVAKSGVEFKGFDVLIEDGADVPEDSDVPF